MVNRPAIAQTKRPRPKAERPPVWKFEIIYEDSNQNESFWSRLRRNLAPLLEATREALDATYAAGARRVLERKEELEDRRAERKVRRRVAVRSATSANSAPEIHLVEVGVGLNGLASRSKSHA